MEKLLYYLLMLYVYEFSTRMCAKEALKDVVEYLNVDSGQVAVSKTV